MKRFFHVLSLLFLLTSLLEPFSVARAETSFQTSQAQAIWAAMTPEERVGQVFLVTFRGTDTHDQTEIYDLIANHHVGGVILQASNDNFLPAPDTIPAAHQLISDLQTIEWQSSTPPAPGTSAPPATDPVYVPLFIGISQEGDGPPNDQILSGLTPVPNLMAIGATWRTDLAEEMGAIVGRELSALGINLYLGPSLDVVDSPNPAAQIDLGTRVFGGDPFWAGEMGKAFISGLHTGSDNRMLVIAKHFPGRGDADRSPEEEVPTVRKSLEQLKQVELAPFFAVTNAPEASAQADGLLVSHIRYQGFQGNIRATTRPVSLDTATLPAIIRLEEFSAWRSNGGLIVSNSLGSQAIRDFYSLSGENFLPRSVARDAFMAGNDLLYLGNITSADPEGDTYDATLEILEYFVQQYQADRAFAQLVDSAVLRILEQKFKIYEEFNPSTVIVPESRLAVVGTEGEAVSEVARNAATLISPNPEDLSSILPSPPIQTDRIVFLTDTVNFKQCTTCLWEEGFTADALHREVIRLYGSTGSGQVFESRLNSFPLSEVELMLNEETETDIEGILERANWIVISLTSVSDEQIPLLRRFFSERPNLIRDKRVILFAFTAPYYLDATDISKLTAYYALYSKQPAFVEMAARLLFQPTTLRGASPVSILGVGYDLIVATSPDEDQIIPLALDQNSEVTPTAESDPLTPQVTPTQTPIPRYRIGDTIAVRAGPIVDHNQNIVPDGTPVRFIMSTVDENGEILQTVDSTTVEGVARASFAINRPGKVSIRVVSEPAVISGVLQFDASNEGAVVTFVAPTQVTPTPQATPTITPTPVPENDLVSPEGYPRVGIWLLVMLAVVGGAVLMFWAVSRLVSPRWGLRWALCVFLGGLAAYNYLALDFPGAAEWIATSAGAFGVLILTFAGQLLGSVGAWVWMRFLSGSRSREG